jgi:hypothetical protein
VKAFINLGASMCAVVSAVLLSGCAAQQEPCCASQPIKPFKAVYEYKAGDAAPITQAWLSNGKGQVVMMPAKGSATDPYTLVDYTTGESTALNPATKTAVSSKLEMPWISNGTCEETNATILGDKTIDGHPCKGWKVTNGNTTSEYWLGEDTGCYVQIISTLPNDKTAEFKLVEFEPTVDPAAKFEVPEGYSKAGSTSKIESASSGKSADH